MAVILATGAMHQYSTDSAYLPTRDDKERVGASKPPAPAGRRARGGGVGTIARPSSGAGDDGRGGSKTVEFDPALDEAQVTVVMTRLDQIWDQLFPAEQQRIVRLLVEKVIVSPRDMEVMLQANGIEELAIELRPAVPEEEAA